MTVQSPWTRRSEKLVKIEEETDPSYGCPPANRPLDQHLRFGLIDLDKPSGPSSHEVVAWVKRLMRLKHAGHGGTLEAGEMAGAIRWSRACSRSLWRKLRKQFRPSY